MKTQVFFLLLFFVASESFSQVNKSDQDFTNVYHYWNNISLKNFDGTRSTIYVNGNSATLINSDGSLSTIDFCESSSTSASTSTSILVAIDGTSSSVFYNGLSSIILNSDGTQILVNHMQNSSSCSTTNGKHTIMHTFGAVREMKYKDKIDVLIHCNWLIQKQAVEATDELNEKLEN